MERDGKVFTIWGYICLFGETRKSFKILLEAVKEFSKKIKSKYIKLKSSFIYQILPVKKYKGKKNSIFTRTQRPWRERTIFVHYCSPSSWNSAWHVGDNNKHLLNKWMNNNENIPKWLGAINIKYIGPLHKKTLTYTEGYKRRVEKVNNWILLGSIWDCKAVNSS